MRWTKVEAAKREFKAATDARKKRCCGKAGKLRRKAGKLRRKACRGLVPSVWLVSSTGVASSIRMNVSTVKLSRDGSRGPQSLVGVQALWPRPW